MSRKEIKKWAWKKTKKNYWDSLLPILIMSAFIALSGRVIDFLGNTIWGDLLSGLSSLALIPLTIGTIKYFMSISKDKEPEVEDMFKPYKNAFRMIGAVVFSSLIVLGGFILFIIPGIYFAYALALVPYLLITKPKTKVLDIIDLSIKQMKGHKWELFKFELSFIGWHILSVLTIGLLYIWVIPYMTNARTKYILTIIDKDSIIVA